MERNILRRLRKCIKDYKNWMDKRGSETEMLCIVLFWVLIFDPLVLLISRDVEVLSGSQIIFVVLILMPYILWRTSGKRNS